MTMSTPASPRRGSAVVGIGCCGVATMAMTSGAGRSRSTSRTIGCDGLRRATSPDGETRARTSSGQPPIEPVGHRPGEDQGRRARPEPPGQPAAQLRDPGHPVGDLLGPLQQQGQRPRGLGRPQLPHPRHAARVQRAGHQAVDRLGRQPDDAALAPGRRRHDGPRHASRRPATRRSTAAKPAGQPSFPSFQSFQFRSRRRKPGGTKS